MDPRETVKKEKKPSDPSSVRHQVLTYYQESKSIRNVLEQQWAKNQKIVKGIPIHKEKEFSSVHRRPKIRFRKTWSSIIRILASLYQAFLLDENKFQIRGFDDVMDWMKAEVLHTMVKFRLNWMFRRRDGFTKFIWAFLDCISPGTGVVKVHWRYNEDQNIDEPCLTNYPLEQTCLDWAASTPYDMRYAILENYLTMDQMKSMGYMNLDKAIQVSIPVSTLRATRFHKVGDPMRVSDKQTGTNYMNGTVGNHYPHPGYGDDVETEAIRYRYRVLECWYRKENVIYFCVINPDSGEWLQKPEVSPYGKDIYPIAVGSMLLEAHKLVPESITEPLEGPQEDLNMTLNLRKQNQLLAMMGGWSIDKFAGVDVQALSNLRPGFIVRRNSGQGVIEPIKLPDVTQTSYVESNADQVMIEEMSGITPTKQGQTTTDKTGVAAISLQESNAKEALFIATVGNTLFKQIIYLLAYQIQKFETDERIFRVANAQLRQDRGDQVSDVYDLEFDMDVEVAVGLNEVSRQALLQRQFMLVQNALQANNATALLLKSGAQILNPTLVDVGKILLDIAPNLGIKNINQYLIPVTPPQQPERAGQEQAQIAEGQNAPQPNQREEAFQNFMQQIPGQ